MNNLFTRSACGLLGLAVLCSTAGASDHLKLNSGRKLTGEAVAYDHATQTLTFVTSGGEELKLKADALDRVSAYKLAKTHVDPNNAEEELRLAVFASDINLFVHAGRHLDKAERLDPNLAGEVAKARAEVKSSAASFCMEHAQKAMASGDKREAEKWLTTIVSKLADQPQAAEASKMLQGLYPENHDSRDDHLEASHENLLEGELKTGKKYYDQMLKDIQSGLTNTRTTSTAKREFERAWSNGERALKELDRVGKRLSKEQSDTTAAFAEYRSIVIEHMVESQLHLASMLSVQTDYKDAIKAVNLALSVDPNNRDAKAARARIENSASNGWRW